MTTNEAALKLARGERLIRSGYHMGERVNEHCPYDETTLRVDLERPGWHVCPICFSPFVPLNEGTDNA